MPLCGGIGEAKPADDDVKDILSQVKSQVEGKTNASYDCFEAVSYGTQVVAGTNYFIKVKVGEGKYIHVRVFRPLPCNNGSLELSAVEEGKTEQDPIAYFQ